jgi:ferritin-like metal-binding protein YciE
MPEAQTLRTLFIDELRDVYDAERQLIKALPTMARAATLTDLRSAFETHLRETRTQATRAEKVFKMLGERVRGKHCEGMAGIIKEGKAILEQDLDGATLDAALIAAAQRVEHYEIGAYGTLVAWAGVLDLPDAAELLQESLDEEGETNKALTGIAESRVNRDAASDGAREDPDAAQTSAVGGLLRRLTGGPTQPSRRCAAPRGRRRATTKRASARTSSARKSSARKR